MNKKALIKIKQKRTYEANLNKKLYFIEKKMMEDYCLRSIDAFMVSPSEVTYEAAKAALEKYLQDYKKYLIPLLPKGPMNGDGVSEPESFSMSTMACVLDAVDRFFCCTSEITQEMAIKALRAHLEK